MHSRCMHYSYITQTLVIPNLGVGVHLQVPIVAALCQQLRLSHCSTFNPHQPDVPQISDNAQIKIAAFSFG